MRLIPGAFVDVEQPMAEGLSARGKIALRNRWYPSYSRLVSCNRRAKAASVPCPLYRRVHLCRDLSGPPPRAARRYSSVCCLFTLLMARAYRSQHCGCNDEHHQWENIHCVDG